MFAFAYTSVRAHTMANNRTHIIRVLHAVSLLSLIYEPTVRQLEDGAAKKTLMLCVAAMNLVCNVCYADLGAGIIYRTSCRHFLCPNCAKSSFTGVCSCEMLYDSAHLEYTLIFFSLSLSYFFSIEHCECPVCQHKLSPGDVTELVAGV